MMDEISQKEIHYLYELINRGVLRPASKSIVTFELTKLLDRLNLPSINSPSPETPEPKIALFVTSTFHDSKFASEDEKISMSLTVSQNASLTQLVRDIETAQTYRPNSRVHILQHIRSGRVFTDYDNSSIKSCDFRDGDRVIVQCKLKETSAQTIESVESVDPMITTIDSVKPNSSNDIIVAACHYFMRSQGFLYLTEQPSTVAGFAPSLKEVSKDTFLVQGWNSWPVNILYKHKLKPGKIFELQCSPARDDSVRIALAQRKGESFAIEFKISDYIVQDCGLSARNIYNVEELNMKLLSVLVDHLPALAPQPPAQQPQQPEPQRIILRDEKLESDLRSPMSTSSAFIASASAKADRNHPASVGSFDLNPFPSAISIGASRGADGGGGGGGLGGLHGGGSLVGPEHPMFRGTYPPAGADGSGLGIGGLPTGPRPWMDVDPDPSRDVRFPLLPKPRYDPTGPVLGPHTDICGEDEDFSGEDPMFRRARGRGGRGGRGPGSFNIFPGEPGPDHFKPPGWN